MSDLNNLRLAERLSGEWADDLREQLATVDQRWRVALEAALAECASVHGAMADRIAALEAAEAEASGARISQQAAADALEAASQRRLALITSARPFSDEEAVEVENAIAAARLRLAQAEHGATMARSAVQAASGYGAFEDLRRIRERGISNTRAERDCLIFGGEPKGSLNLVALGFAIAEEERALKELPALVSNATARGKTRRTVEEATAAAREAFAMRNATFMADHIVSLKQSNRAALVRSILSQPDAEAAP